MDLIAKFSVTGKITPDELQGLFAPFLAPDEEVKLAYTNVRDKVAFTDRKLIAMDVQGLTGKKKSFRFFPYSKISSFSVESAGTFDLDADFKIWVSGVGCFEIKFGTKIDITEVGTFLSSKI